MTRQILFSFLALISLGSETMAQDAGGVKLAPGTKSGPVGLARPLPFTRPPLVTAQDLQNGMTAASSQTQDQNMITALRGDAGFLAGFSFGTPLAASRQPVPSDGGYYYRHHHHGNGNGPVIINNDGPLAVTVGNGNVVQQQSASGPGPIAQQQVATTPNASARGGAVNLVSGSGNIIQRAPGGN
jgi:hypothetical protein